MILCAMLQGLATGAIRRPDNMRQVMHGLPDIWIMEPARDCTACQVCAGSCGLGTLYVQDRHSVFVLLGLTLHCCACWCLQLGKVAWRSRGRL
jgi:hypothetical protein